MTDIPVDFIPLGGLSEIGLNMMLLECGDDSVIIDAGLMFPEEHMYGVDVVIPDFSYLLTRPGRIRGVILTHGHEDHIGALPFLLKQLDAPVYGTRFTLALVKEKLKEHRMLSDVSLNVVVPRQRLELGPFTFEFIRVSHSIVDGVALGIETPAGLFVHTGDFKMEQSPPEGERLDLGKFAEFGERGVLTLLSDSTNVERAGFTMSEQKIGGTFRDIFRTCPGRIIVSAFASSIVRIQQVVDVAAEFGRRVAFDGRSMVTNVRLARELDFLKLPEGMEATVGELKNLPDDKAVLITTGSQGEPMSALARMANNDHKKIKVKSGDTVILSSRFIPGNERAITKIINNLYRLGAEVIYETVSEIHVSGHAYREELKLMINLTRPKYFIPIHGEYRHLKKHIELAHQVGVPEENLILAENGDRVRFDRQGGRKVGRIETGRVLVDGKGVGDIGQLVLRDRRHLAEDGMVIPLLVIDDQTGEILSGPDIISKGFIFEEDQPVLIEDAKCLILEILDRLSEEREPDKGLPLDVNEIQAEIHRELKRFFYRVLKRRPLIIPQVLTL
ncbi:MAG: ribonuclease J [Thermodesulfobacteriota bacterium]|nr:ribonuclease J [Thermodesulfobacteriota bacterium]